MKTLLVNYVRYNLWANNRILDKLRAIEPTQWTADQKSSFPSILLTLLHFSSAEIVWLNRLNGTKQFSWPADEFKGGNEEAANMLTNSSQALLDFVGSMSDDDFHREHHYNTRNGDAYTTKACDMILHCMNHSTFHRGQIVTMLRNVGVTDLPATDYIAYVRMQSQVI